MRLQNTMEYRGILMIIIIIGAAVNYFYVFAIRQYLLIHIKMAICFVECFQTSLEGLLAEKIFRIVHNDYFDTEMKYEWVAGEIFIYCIHLAKQVYGKAHAK